MNLIQRGYLNGARRSFTNAINSVSSAAQHSGASRGTQNPIGFTKPFSSNLADLALLPLAATLAGEISHGEQRLLEVAMLSAIAPKLMLLDEPTSGMGKAETRELIEVLRRLAREHTLVLAEHDMDVVFTLADRVTVLVNGAIMATGAPEEVRRDPGVRSAYLRERV
jgi:branched-chain amino acid transport system ATP-binding protein